jgi:hypothetical protein
MRRPGFGIYNISYGYFRCGGAKEQSGLELILKELEESQNNLQLILDQLEQSEQSDQKLREELIELQQLFKTSEKTLSEQIPKQTGPESPEGNETNLEVNKAKFVNQRIKYYTEYGSSSNNKTVRKIDLPVKEQPVKEQPVKEQPVKEESLTEKEFAVKAHNIFAQANIKKHNFEKNEDNRGYKYEIEITGKHEVRIVDKETGDLYTATFEKSDGSYKMTCSVDRIIKKETEKEPKELWEDMKKCMKTEGHTLNVKFKGNNIESNIESDKKELHEIEQELKQCEFIKNWQKLLAGAVGGALGGGLGGVVGGAVGQGVALVISHFFVVALGGVACAFSVPAIAAAAGACAIVGIAGGLYYGWHSKKDDFCGVLGEVFKQSSWNSFASSAIMGFAHPLMALGNLLEKLVGSGVAGGLSRMAALAINNSLNGSTNECTDYLKIGAKSAFLGMLFGGVDLAVDGWLDSRHLDWLDPRHLGWVDPTANVVANVALNYIPNYLLNNTNDKYQFLLPLLTGLSTVFATEVATGVMHHNEGTPPTPTHSDNNSSDVSHTKKEVKEVNEFHVVAKQIADAPKVHPIPQIIPVGSSDNHIPPPTEPSKNHDNHSEHSIHTDGSSVPTGQQNTPPIILYPSEVKDKIDLNNGQKLYEVHVYHEAQVNKNDDKNGDNNYKLYMVEQTQGKYRGIVNQFVVVDADNKAIACYSSNPNNPAGIIKGEPDTWHATYWSNIDKYFEKGSHVTHGKSVEDALNDDGSHRVDRKIANFLSEKFGLRIPTSSGNIWKNDAINQQNPIMFGKSEEVRKQLTDVLHIKFTEHILNPSPSPNLGTGQVPGQGSVPTK